MLLAEFCALYVHRQVYGVWVPGTEKLAIWGGINVEELPREDAICALQQVVVVASLT